MVDSVKKSPEEQIPGRVKFQHPFGRLIIILEISPGNNYNLFNRKKIGQMVQLHLWSPPCVKQKTPGT